MPSRSGKVKATVSRISMKEVFTSKSDVRVTNPESFRYPLQLLPALLFPYCLIDVIKYLFSDLPRLADGTFFFIAFGIMENLLKTSENEDCDNNKPHDHLLDQKWITCYSLH